MAPELLRGLGYREKCDLFALGSIFFNLMTGMYLFQGTTKADIVRFNRECDLSHLKSCLSETIDDLAKNLLL